MTATGEGPMSRLSDDDLHLFNEGTHSRLYDHLGNHPVAAGTVFGVWAPAADEVAVIGDFNGWDGAAHPLVPRGSSGIWEGVVADAADGHRYKYRIRNGSWEQDKADPFAQRTEVPPATASVVGTGAHEWGDGLWMAEREACHAHDAPVSVYEVHLGSWRRPGGGLPHYREIAEPLSAHVRAHGFTHVEFLPLTSTPSTDRGATRPPATSRPRPGTANRGTSWPSSTDSTRTASA